jgi:NADPH:quinone reductase-like Zn-dependent oxidoreductase
MKVFEMTSAGGPDVLRYAERPTPEPGVGQVLIEVRYAGLNFTDVLARRGLPAYSTGFPFVPGMETALPELDVVLESIGGKTLAGAASALAVGGRLVTYGVAGGEPDPVPPGYGELRVGNHTVTGFSIMARARKKPDSVRRLLLDVLSATEAGLEIPAPIIVRWDDARQAHIDQSEGRSRGKSIVDVQS